MDSDVMPLLMSLQVLSGKLPWSEVREDLAIVLRLAKGNKPGRPESRTLDDSHWDFIQDCWSEIEERPAAEVIMSTIKQFLYHFPQTPPLRDLLRSWSSEADLGTDSSLSLCQILTEGSSTHVTQAASDEDDQSRYMMIILIHSITLTPWHIRLTESLPFPMYRAWTDPTRAENAACH